MSILIKGMKTPKNCFTCDCPCLNGESGYCQADKEQRSVYGDRPYWCPLIPIPDHGRLIDAWEFEVVSYKGIPDGYKDTFDDGVLWMCEKIDEAPTIIPADEEETE